MNVVVSTEARFTQTPDGRVWTRTPCTHEWWFRYLAVFENVRVLARVSRSNAVGPEWRRADGPHVSFAPVPYYVGPAQYLKRAVRIKAAIRGAVGRDDAVILRVGSPIANCLEPVLHREGRPFALEVVGDPYDVFAPGAVRHILRPFYRWWFSRSLRRQCQRACGAAYVTTRTLQHRYPSVYSFAVSDAPIAREPFASASGPFTAFSPSVQLKRSAPHFRTSTPPANHKLVFVGSLEQTYKGPDVLIDAVAICIQNGQRLGLTIVGDGRCRPALEDRVRKAGLDEVVVFRGEVPPGSRVQAELDDADLFVLPSRTEGLPRALVEAMARGLPCIGSSAGGIPELLDPDDLVPPGNARALAGKMTEVLADPDRMRRMATRNLEHAQEFHEDVLRVRRQAFLQHVRAVTEEWLRGRATSPSYRHSAASRRDTSGQVPLQRPPESL